MTATHLPAQLVYALVLLLLFLNVLPDRGLIASYRGHPEAPRPELFPCEFALPPSEVSRNVDRVFPFTNPTTCDTAYLGGMLTSMCT